MSGGAIVRLDAVTRRFGRGSDVFALGPLSLEIEPGSFTLVSGPSGAGKTTLLSLLAGLDRPDQGAVHLFGADVTRASESALARLRRDAIVVVPQRVALLDHLPLWQNVTCRLVPAGVPARERRERAQRALAALDLSGKDDRRPRELSGGEQQRAVLARALVTEPRLLVADEPTSNVDARTAERIGELFAALRARGTTLIVASHDRSLEQRADRRLTLERGRFVEAPA